MKMAFANIIDLALKNKMRQGESRICQHPRRCLKKWVKVKVACANILGLAQKWLEGASALLPTSLTLLLKKWLQGESAICQHP